MVIFITAEIDKELAKYVATEVNSEPAHTNREGFTLRSNPSSEREFNKLTIYVDSPGGSVPHSDSIYYSILSNAFKFSEIDLVIVGDCSSAAFDLCYSLSKMPNINVYVGRSTLFCVHTLTSIMVEGRSPELEELLKEERVEDIKSMVSLFIHVLNKKQLRDLKKGRDVFLSNNQAIKVLNAKPIK